MGGSFLTTAQLPNSKPRPFGLALLALLALSLLLHFVGLSRFNMLVFDELSYAKYAHNYINHLPVFDVHPPLGKLLIGAGLWLADGFGYGAQLTNALSGAERAAWAYRWVDALFGSVLPLLVAGVGWQLTGRTRLALVSGLLVLLSGIFLVEARYALINIFMVTFGLGGHWLWLRGLTAPSAHSRHLHWLLAGLALGACVSVKWNGLSFLGVVWAITVLSWVAARRAKTSNRFSQLNWSRVLGYFVLVPALLYGLQWTPHLQTNNTSFQEAHSQILSFHQNMKDGPGEHPYCSRWTTWPFMLKPISFLYEPGRDSAGPLPPYSERIPTHEQRVVYVVHELINPLLAWSSCLALLWLVAAFAYRSERIALARQASAQQVHELLTFIYLLLGFASGWLPWAFVGRCQFVYLYMPSLAFAILASAWALEQLMSHPLKGLRYTGYAVLGSVAGSFVFFLPIYLGLPISQASFYARMWLGSWI